MSLIDKIMAADDVAREKVDVPEWGVTLYMHSMTGRERDKYEESVYSATKGKVMKLEGLRAQVIISCAHDEAGNKVFDPEDVVKLQTKSGRVIRRLSEIALKVSGFDDEELEELEKNS